MFRLLADENFNADIVRGLLLREPGLDLLGVAEAGLSGAEDPEVLTWAAAHDRILLTHDRATMPDFAHARMVRAEPMPGVIVVPDRMAIRQAIDEVLLIVRGSTVAEWAGVVVYLPL